MYIKSLKLQNVTIRGAQTRFGFVTFKDGIAKVTKEVGEALVAKYPQSYEKARKPRG